MYYEDDRSPILFLTLSMASLETCFRSYTRPRAANRSKTIVVRLMLAPHSPAA